jgi:hypothetical protein
MFVLQIAHPDGVLARFPAGGPLEREFIEACVTRALAKGVGIFKTQAQVETALREAVTEAIWNLKEDSRYAVK